MNDSQRETMLKTVFIKPENYVPMCIQIEHIRDLKIRTSRRNESSAVVQKKVDILESVEQSLIILAQVIELIGVEDEAK